MKLQLVYSCYLIKHGDDYMVWDSGHAHDAPARWRRRCAARPSFSASSKLKPEQIKYVGISHFHGDHIGQVASLPNATLLIGKGDWDVLLTATQADGRGANVASFTHWISGGGKVEPGGGQGRVRRRHRHDAEHARAYAGPPHRCSSVSRKRAP